MNTIQRIAKNTFVMIIVRVLVPAFSFILIWYIAHLLGVSDLGKYSFLMAFFGIFVPVSVLGLNTLITREVAKDKNKASKYFINALIIGLLSSIFFSGVMCLIVNVMKYEADVILLTYIMALSLIISSAIAYCESLFRAFEKFEFIAYSTVIENIFKVTLGTYFLLKGYGLISVIIVIVVACLLRLFLSFYFIIRYITKPHLEIDFSFCKQLAKNTLVFAGISIISIVYWRIDIVMLSKLRNMEEVGFYSAAYRLLLICKVIPQNYTLAIFPVISKIFESSLSSFKSICEKSIKYLFIVILPVAVGVTILSRNFILLIYGDKFLNSIYVLQILIWTLVPYSAVIVFARLLLASGNQKIDFQINVIGLICNITLNLVLIPKMGYIGASISTLISICIFLGLQCIFIFKNIFKINFIHIAGKTVIASVTMGIFIFFFKHINLFLLILLSSIVYSLSLFILKVFTKEDWKLFQKLVVSQ